MPRLYVPASDIKDELATLRGTEFRHLQRVLRLREGDQVTLFDDQGYEHDGVIVSLSPRLATVRIFRSAQPARESPLRITLYQALPKGRKMDLVIEKVTELGVHAVVPFTSAFSSATGPAAAKRERWERIAVAAAKQSGRVLVPVVGGPHTLQEVLVEAARDDLKLLFFEGDKVSPFAGVASPPGTPSSAAVVVGSEGGFSREEVEAARAAGFVAVGLGPRILRAETAALAAVALVQARWGDLGNR